LEDPSVDGRIILRCIFRKCEGMEWNNVVQDRDRWRALVNAVLKWMGPHIRSGRFEEE
jgi:hypothetical protein